MAKPTKQQPSINELGGLPPEFSADTEQEKNDGEILVESTTQDKPTDNFGAGDNSADDSDEMEIVVVKGQTLRHSGETHAENSRLFLPHDDAERLISLGVVVDVKALRQQEARISGPSITVDDGVKINRGS
ncbi:hypothetical protein [Yersinia proxima]|uniref:hypothetical protein n=1 Tax=Yersinia proxima TaxID=2890316 RepID=UPI001D1020B7|nr:hypothetical protein [Yersinia proxima]